MRRIRSDQGRIKTGFRRRTGGGLFRITVWQSAAAGQGDRFIPRKAKAKAKARVPPAFHFLIICIISLACYHPRLIRLPPSLVVPCFFCLQHQHHSIFMACQVLLHSWTFSGLVAAFLHLLIAYLLLCCSALSFFIAKFLAFFGFSLPCPCHGFFYRRPCLQRLLVDGPADSISSVQLSVKTKFPFNAILSSNDHCQLNLKLIRERTLEDGALEYEGEASYSSFSDPRRSQHSISGSDSVAKFDLKGKGAATQRHRFGLRRRRRGSLDYDKLTSSSYYGHLRSDVRAVHRSPSDTSKSDPQNASVVPTNTVPDFEANYETDENKVLYDYTSLFENLKNSVGRGRGLDGQDDTTVRFLEQALEREQVARVALCSELEQERTAAATAADEAMAMISRLQEEKASIEIEARQYQRILEEKSAYDAEEMNILKEIIVRREREKHFLEKEVEAYRKVLQENERLENQADGTQDQDEAAFPDSSVDPMLILQQLSDSIDKQGSVWTKTNYLDDASTSIEKQISTVSMGKQSSILKCDDAAFVKGTDSPGPDNLSMIQDQMHDGDEYIQEKGILSVDEILYPQLSKSNSSRIHEFFENNIIAVGESRSNNNVHSPPSIIPGIVKTHGGKELQMQVSVPHVHDVHITDSRCGICDKSTEKRVDPLLLHSNASKVARSSEPTFEASNLLRVQDSANNSVRGEPDINRSCSDIADRFSSWSGQNNRSVVSELRRNSLSAVDQERLKIDSEIGWLRTRLRAVQEEKEKLRNSLEKREPGKVELQLLEDIAAQLREIRHLTGSDKAGSQAPLPPLSSKGTSKKRRSRSTSVAVDQSAST